MAENAETRHLRNAHISRRRLLVYVAVSNVISMPNLAWPASSDDIGDADFLSLSKAATGHIDLSTTTARRMLAAFKQADPGFARRATSLWQLHHDSQNPEEMLAEANAKGLHGTMLELIAGWYTGTVGAGENTHMVSYADALMYRPVADGLTIPTYCSNGPAWWTASPPLVGVGPPPANAPSPHAPAPTPSESPKSNQP
jgi:hypothetical protein